MKRIVVLVVVLVIVVAAVICVSVLRRPVEPPAKPPAKTEYKLDAALEKKAVDSISRGVEFLLSIQNEDGSWGRHKHPAIAALGAMSLHQAPGVPREETEAAVTKAMEFVLSFKQDDGSIYPAELHKRDPQQSGYYPNHTTAIVLLCLATLDRPQDREAMIKARKFLMNSQFSDESQVDYGGIGYGKTGRGDVTNSLHAAEALHYTEYLDREPHSKDPEAPKRTAAMWSAMAEFLTKCQNLPELNKQPYVSDHKDDEGGFIYRPNESKAGSREGEGSTNKLISSGSVTYAGLMTMLYARLKRSDIRVKGAMKYLLSHYTLKENPGMGKQGLFYYLHVMTKALEAYGVPILTDAKGQKHDWRQDIINEFLALQSPEKGSWVNTHGRYMESMPELATSYAVISLKIATGKSTLKYK